MMMTILYTLDQVVPVDPAPRPLHEWPKLSESVDLAIRRMESEPRFYHAVRSLEAMLMRDVDCYLDALEDALDRANQAKRLVLAGGVPDFHAGDHCTYCPGADSCPSKTNLARAMLGDLQALDGAIEVMSDQQARGAYEKAHDQIKPVLDRILEGLKERARRSPIPLAEGLELREAPYSKQQPDFAAAVTLARSLGATEAQIKEECFKSTIVRPVKACKVLR